ncbi:2-methylaconitate cis-trans-isomerase PrpF [Nocardioides zeae]|uniref:2-methylaconitate cis-trans-isomerase PrpF n=2 Tax=Nocardioides zeae TaxID=1457234 RepID=A0AAJ1U501_9ACTN|nr:PrpF domain-containing protein [Nocardioides zeae]MDQ1105648.1 2-methylaconitate cis-trans-isomerase PrpF [Nocardioides zeae]MDR6174702.1 2-methylaconitate cis-trans-isomerase PrpF [Nocardioides zeae]MDR6210771.1 2-methylaconitate cis-trans-isomerase PrpF [Nocardioides zeae]
MREIEAVWMRGGTSKCWVFRDADLRLPELSVDEVLLRAFGSPDHRQVDGVGGGTSTTSKAVILAPSERPGADVDYTFAQVGIDEAKVDWGSNCGNCSAVVAAYAVREGWVRATDGETVVRVHNTNTGQLILQLLATPGGVLDEEGSTAIPGVPFLGAPVRMGFVDPVGRTTGALLPSGSTAETIEVDGTAARVTLVDAGAPVVAVLASSVGLRGDEPPARIDADRDLLDRLDRIRREGAVRMGLAPTPAEAERAVPKLALVSADPDGEADVRLRMLSMGQVHPAAPITGSVALTFAARTPGTVVHDLLADGADAPASLRLATPAGTVATFFEVRDGAPVVGVVRTYRRLASGVVHLPQLSSPDTAA